MIEQKLYDTLRSNSCNPYWPGQYTGTCQERYLVINGPAGNATNTAARTDLIDIILFAPRPQLQDGQFLSIEEILQYRIDVLEAMRQLPYEWVSDTPVIVDEEAMAYTLSLQYQVRRRR